MSYPPPDAIIISKYGVSNRAYSSICEERCFMKKNKIGSILVAVAIIGIVIGIILIYFIGFEIIPGVPLGVRIVAALICAGIIYGVLHILIERIREIQKGEDDDLSNY